MRRRFMQLKNNNLPLYFEALEDGLFVSFSNDLEYCIDDSEEWIKLSASELTPQINTGQIIKFRSSISPDNSRGCGTFIVTKRFKAGGNPLSLVLYNIIDANCFLYLFNNCENLVDASQIILSTTLAYRCYYSMFSGCTNLIAAPELPATVLTSHCYTGMFEDCTSLVNAPELPATALVTNCYNTMFRNCTNLKYIKMLATDIPATYSLWDWVRGVSSTGTFVKSKDATWDTTPGALGYDGVPSGWTVVNDGEESGGGLINFTIDGTSYQAEEGMTWEEWVNSKYNTTKNYYFSDLDVLKRISDDYYIYDGEGNLSKQENIIDNFNYSAYYSGSNDDF